LLIVIDVVWERGYISPLEVQEHVYEMKFNFSKVRV